MWSSAPGIGCTPSPRASSRPGTLRARPRCPTAAPLVRANRDGTFSVVIDRLNQPTSLEFIGKTAYVVTLGGEIWKIKGV